MSTETKEKLRYERPMIRKMNAGLMNKFGTVPNTSLHRILTLCQ